MQAIEYVHLNTNIPPWKVMACKKDSQGDMHKWFAMGSPSSDPPASLSWPSGSPSSEPLAGSSWSGNMLPKKPSHDEKKTAHKTAPKQVVEGSQYLTPFQVGVMGISTRTIVDLYTLIYNYFGVEHVLGALN